MLLRYLIRAAVVLYSAFLTMPSWAACGDTEGDRLVWARERMFPAAAPKQTEQVYQWLVNSTRSCNQSGDLWYYRGLVARKLGNATDATYAFGKAEENGSKARSEKFDPFTDAGVRVSSPAHIRDKYALLVGIHEFLKSDSNLRYSAEDAKTLRKVLVSTQNFKDDKDHIHTLLDSDATLANIEQALGEIRARAQADDLVFVYLSSHGVPRDLGPDGLSYVMTADFDATNAATAYRTGLKMVELAEFGRFIKANNYVLVLDTCYSGAVRQIVPEEGKGLDPLQGLVGSANRVVISASRDQETSIEDEASKHGLFTRYLLDALHEKDSADLNAVFKSVQEHVTAEAERNHSQQHPVMLSYGQGAKITLGSAVQADLLRPHPLVATSNLP